MQSGFKMLHEDLVNIGQKLDDVNNNLKEVIEHIDQTTNSIQQLHQATLDFHQTVRQGLDNLDIQMAQVNQRLIDVRDSIAEGFRETNQSMKDGFTTLTTTVQTGFDNQLAMLETMNQSIVEGFENTNQSLAVIGQKIDYTNDNIAQLNNSMIEGFGSVNANLGRIDNNLTAGFNTINSSLDVIGNKLNQMDQHVIEGFRQTNLNIDKTNQKLDILDKNVRKGFEAQRQLTKQVLYETRQSNRQLSELKSISVAGFQNIGNQLRSTNAMLQSMQVQNRAKASSSKRGIFGKILGTVVGAAASCIPAVGPIVGPIAGGLVSNLVGGDSSASFDGPVVKPADLPKAIFNDVKTEVVDRVKDKLAKSVPTVFQEDKWRILDTAVKLSKNGKKIPKGYEDLIFKSKNSDDLLKNVVHLADYCEISPKSLVYAAKHIF